MCAVVWIVTVYCPANYEFHNIIHIRLGKIDLSTTLHSMNNSETEQMWFVFFYLHHA